MQNHSLSVIITAYNEEKTVADAIAATDAALKKYVRDYEIIVVDDGSVDATGKIVDAIAHRNNKVRGVHNKPNRNIGYNMRLGVSLARKEYSMVFVNADNYPDEKTFRELFSAIGEKDIILGYLVGYGDRHWLRRFLSWAFTKIMNLLFGFHIRYYNGPTIARTDAWRTVPMTTDGFAYMAEVVTTFLKRKVTYKEVPIIFSPERKGINVAVLQRNIWSVTKTLASLFWRLNVKKALYANGGQTSQV